MMRIKLFLMVPVLMLLSACGQVTATRGASFVDPAFHGVMFNSIVIDVRNGNLTERQAIEHSAAGTLGRAGVRGTPALSIVPPTREYGETVRRRDIMNTGAQAVLEIIPREKEIIETYMGSRYHDPRPWYRWHNRAYWDDPFYRDPPIWLEEPEARYEVTLYALPKYNTVWTADITTRGPTGMSFDEVGANFGREIIERLAKDGLVPALQ